MITKCIDVQKSGVPFTAKIETLPKHGLHLSVLSLHAYILAFPKTLVQKADTKVSTSGPTAHLIVLIPGTDLPINHAARCQRLSCIGNPQAFITHHLATVPQVGLLLSQQLRTGGRQYLVSGLAESVLTGCYLPAQSRIRVVYAPGLMQHLAPKVEKPNGMQPLQG